MVDNASINFINGTDGPFAIVVSIKKNYTFMVDKPLEMQGI